MTFGTNTEEDVRLQTYLESIRYIALVYRPTDYILYNKFRNH